MANLYNQMNLYFVYCISFFLLTLTYGLQVPDDLASKILIAIQLIYLSGCFDTGTVDNSLKIVTQKRYILMLWLMEIVLLADAVFKVGIIVGWWNGGVVKELVNDMAVQGIMQMRIGSLELEYIGMFLLLIVILCTTQRIIIIKSLPELKQKATVLLDTSRYLSIGMLYSIVYLETSYQEFIWVCICCLYVVYGKERLIAKRIVNFVLAGSLIGEFLVKDPNLKDVFPIKQLYLQRVYSIESEYTPYVLIGLKLICTYLINRDIEWDLNKTELLAEDDARRSTVKMALRRRKTSLIQSEALTKIYLIHGSTLFILLTHSTPGCLVLAIALFLNIPAITINYQRQLIIGATLSLLYQPSNPILFAYLLLVKFIRLPPIHLRTFPFGWITEGLRIIILFSHVSIINFLTGLFKNQYLVLLAIEVRILSRLVGYRNEVIGFGENYGLEGVIKDEAMGDGLFWALLLVMKMTGDTGGPNQIVEWMAVKLQWVLHLLRYFHWIAYILTWAIVLSADQSVFELVQFCLVIGLICCEMFLKDLTKNIMLRRLWNIYLYWLFAIIAVKYFYMFSQYMPDWALFKFLKKYERLVGFSDPYEKPQKALLTDCVLILVCLLSRYIQDMKIAYRSGVRERELQESDNKDSKNPNAFSRVRMTFVSRDIDDINYVYEEFIAPKKIVNFSSRFRMLYRILEKNFVDINFTVIILFSLYDNERHFEYILYGIVMAIHILQINLSSSNFHEVYGQVRTLNSEPPAQTLTDLQSSTKSTSLQTAIYNRQAILLNIIVSSFLILFGYLRILFTAIYYGQYQSQYKFSDIFPQFTIVIVSILVGQLNPDLDQHDIIYQASKLEIKEEDAAITVEMLGVLVKVFQRMFLVYYGTLVLNIDLTALVIPVVVALYFMGQIGYKLFAVAAELTALMGIGLGKGNCLVLLILGKIDLSCKYKASQSILSCLPIKRVHSRHQNAYNCIIYFLPSILMLLTLPSAMYSLLIQNVPIFIALISCIILRFAISLDYNKLRPVLFGSLCYCFSLLLWKTASKLQQKSVWLDRTSIQLLFTLISLTMNLLECQEFFKRVESGEHYISHKGKLLNQMLMYLDNQFKLESLKKFYLEKRRLADKILRVKKEIQSSHREHANSYGNIFEAEDQGLEDNYSKLCNQVFFFNIPTLHELLGCFHHYIKKRPLLNQDIVEMHQRVLNQFTGSFQQTLQNIYATQPNYSASNIGSTMTIPQSEHGSVVLSKKESIEQMTSMEKQHNYQQYHAQLLAKFMPKSQSRLESLLKQLFTNFDYVGYVALIGWNFEGGVYTLPANIIIFVWAMPLEGRNPTKFWRFLLYYLTLIVTLKYLLPYFPQSTIISFVFSTAKRKCVYEYFLLIVVTLELIVDKLFGVESSNETQSVSDGLFRTALNRASFGITHPEQDQYFLSYYKQFCPKGQSSFINQLFSKLNLKPGRDYYPLISSAQVGIFIYIFFFYDMIQLENKKNQSTLESSLSYNQFSKHMVIALFLQIIVMIADRFVTTYNYYDEGEDNLQNFLLGYTFDPGLSPNVNLSRPIYFKSKYDIPLVIKYTIHVVVIVCVNFLVFMYIPGGGSLKMQRQCEESEDGQQVCGQKFVYLMGLFALFLLYFFFNSLQIKSGFTRLKGRNTLMTSYHFISMYIYKTFMAIPFLSEFKKFSDWTLTSTGLPLFHWLKFEDMHSRLYICKCQTEMLRRKPFGVETWWVKYLIAPAGFLSILLIFFGPMVIYSTVNPFAVKDEVIGAEVNLLLRMNLTNFQMFENSHVTEIRKIKDSDTNSELYGNKEKSLYYIQMSKYPDKNSMLTEPTLQDIDLEIQQVLNKKRKTIFELVMQVAILEKEGGKTKYQWALLPLEGETLAKFKALLSGESAMMEIKDFYSPLPGRMKNLNLRIQSRGKYWEVSSSNDVLPLYFITSSKFQVKFGVVSFYLTYVLLISRLMKIYLVANVENVVFEGSELERVLYLCSAVITARRLENFKEQEYFYFELMDLIRSPDWMRVTTGSLRDFRIKCCQPK